MGKVRQSIREKLDPVIQMNIWAGGAGQFEWYEDDGVSLRFDSGESPANSGGVGGLISRFST